MKHDPKYRFAADMTAATLTLRRDFAAPRALVWDCYTRSDLLDRWFAPAPLTTRTQHMDFREGGHWHFAMTEPGGTEYWSRQDYILIAPIDAITLRDSFTDETGIPNPDLPTSEMVMEFTDTDTGTRVRTLVRYASAEALQTVIDMGMEQGLASTLDKLDDLLATLTAKKD